MACISCSRSAFRDVITSMSEKISIWWASNRFLQVSLDSIYRFFSGTTRTIYSWSYFAILKAIRMPWFSVVISWQYPLSHFPSLRPNPDAKRVPTSVISGGFAVPTCPLCWWQKESFGFRYVPWNETGLLIYLQVILQESEVLITLGIITYYKIFQAL